MRVHEQLAALRRERDKLEDKISWIRAALSLELTTRDGTPDLIARRDQIDYELEMLFQRRRALLASMDISRQER